MMYRISAHLATSSVHPALYAISVRTVGISPRTSFPTVRHLPAVVLQVWDSASSRLLADFHRSAHIASVVPKTGELQQHAPFVSDILIIFQLEGVQLRLLWNGKEEFSLLLALAPILQ